MKRVLVMIPTRGRPQEAAEAAQSVLDTSDADVVWYVDHDQYGDYEKYRAPGFKMFSGPQIGPVASVNVLARHFSDYQAYGMITDDARLTIKGWDRWLVESLDTFPNRIGVVSPFHNQGNHVDMPFVSKGWLDAVGWFACPRCQHYAWPIITGLIGEMSGIIHAPKQSFAVFHPEKTEMVRVSLLEHDYAEFFHFVSLELPKTVEAVREAMAHDVALQ